MSSQVQNSASDDEDGWREDTSLDLHILFIEGYCQVPWMETSFVKCPPMINDTRPFSCHKTFRVWCNDPLYLDATSAKPDAYGVERGREEIQSGRYHAIVVMDYSNDEVRDKFEEDFGSLLQEFVASGGVVAFPASEGMCVFTLRKFFDVEWEMSNYYRTTWGPCLEDNEKKINYSFGNGNLARRIVKEYSAKGVSLRKVPPHERCFGVTKDSRTQSLVPTMSGKDVSTKDEEGDYDVIVAMHKYGKGIVAYFGDVNAEEQTIWLVAAFVESRSPKLPIDCSSRIDDDTFSKVVELKEEGNEYFKTGKLDEALNSYENALQLFGKQLGSNGQQRDCYIAILSNMSLIHLKKHQYAEAESAATKALDMEWGHDKCSYRRAMARFKLSQSKPDGCDLTILRKAKDDILNADKTSNATRKLFFEIEAEIKKAKKMERKKFSAGFEDALKGKF